MKERPKGRRDFLKKSALTAASFTIVPRYVLGGVNFVAPSDRIGVGIIGQGKLAINRLTGYMGLPELYVVAGSEVDQEKEARFTAKLKELYQEKEANLFSSYKSYPDFREVLERKDVDAVMIMTPDHWHAVMAVKAAEAKKHVYCEKPLTLTIEEGRKVARAAQRNKIAFQTGSQQRSDYKFRQACELVRNGYIGDIKTVKVSVGGPAIVCDLPTEPEPDNLNWNMWVGPTAMRPYNPTLAPPIEVNVWAKWRDYQGFGGGLLADWGAHMFDIAQWALGMDESGPVKITPPNGADVPHLTFTYANGITMTHEDFGRGYAVRFMGTEGQIDVSRQFLDTQPAELADLEIPEDKIQLYESDHHQKNWLEGIKTGQDTICNAETGHRTASVCSLGNIAYWLERELNWDPDKEQFIGDAVANAFVGRELRDPWKI